MVVCPTCEGDDPACDKCGGRGQTPIVECPKAYVGKLWNVIEYCDLAGNGHWPIAGGVLDQTRCFVDAYQFLRSEDAAAIASREPST